MKVYVTELGGGICSIRTLKQRDIALMFMRPQEYYENPIYQNKLGTTCEQIQEWSIEQDKKNRSYEEVWCDFNIPGEVWRKWYEGSVELCKQGKFSFSSHEKKLIAALASTDGGVFNTTYIIGIYGKKKSTGTKNILRHEIAHARYKTSKVYRNIADRFIQDIPSKIRIKAFKALSAMGYAESVWVDELQAYLVTGLGKSLKKVFKDVEINLALKAILSEWN